MMQLKSSQSPHTSTNAMLFARWQHYLRFCSGLVSLMPQWKQWWRKFQNDPESRIPSGSPPKLNHW